jgi:uncharacterized integral membrane protein
MQKLKLVLIAVLVLFLVLIIAQNTHPIPVRFLWFLAEISAIVLLVLTATGGAVLGLLVAVFVLGKREKNHSSQGSEK